MEKKFRAWDKKEKKMIPAIHIFVNGAGVVWVNQREGLEGTDDLVATDNFVLMQYIGLKDKAGKEIYEGDIRKSFNGDIGVVKYFSKYSRFALSTNNTEDMLPMRICLMAETEYLGTIYTDEHLLGGEVE